MIQIHSIELKDYRQYKGKQRIDLTTSNANSINVIQGENGAGKSNLLNAITFCLYEREEHLEQPKEEGLEVYPYANRDRLEEINIGDQVDGYITIKLGEESPQFIFEREFVTVKQGEDEFSNSAGELKLKMKKDTDWVIESNPNTVLNQILPIHIKDYFLFDGEDLDTFFETGDSEKKGYAEKVKDGIIDVSHIELLDRADNHLTNVREEIRDEDEFSGKEEELREKRNEEEDKLKQLKNKGDEIKRNLDNTREEIKKIDEKLGGSEDKYVRKLQQDREDDREELENLENELEKLQSSANKELIKSGPKVYCSEALEYTLDGIKDLHEAGQLPPKIQDWFIDELIERGTCICGEPIEEHNEENLRELQKEVSEVLDEDLEGKTIIPSILESAGEEVDDLNTFRSEIMNKKEDIRELNEKIKDVSEKLKGYDEAEEDDIDVENLEAQREEAEKRFEELTDDLEERNKKIGLQKDEVEEARKELNQELEKKEEHQELLKKLKFTKTAIDNINGIRETILSKVREDTEENVEEYFNQLIWKDEDYTINITDSYTIEVLDEFGSNKIGSLSAGEKQVLALSFLSALTSISGFNAPIVIDTPLGRISGEPRNRIANNLPDYLEDTQLTLLVTDQEYTKDVRSRLKDNVANEYKLNFQKGNTEVVSR